MLQCTAILFTRFFKNVSINLTLHKQKGESAASATDLALRLLVIDDDLPTLAFMRKVFEKEPVEIFVAGDTSEGLDLLRKKRPHVVMLDLLMPEIGGMEMLEKILEIDPGVDVILISGNYSTEAAVEAIKKGACDYLTKPISVVRLRETA